MSFSSKYEANRKAKRIAAGLPANRPKKKRSSGHSRASSENASINRARRSFVAWDGEGATNAAGRHQYVLLANSRGDYLTNDSLATREILEFILARSSECATGAIHVLFGSTYDITMWIRDLSRNDIACVLKNDTKRSFHLDIDGQLYAISYRPRKHFKLAKFRAPDRPFVRDRKGKWHPDYSASVTIWEVFGFFQSTFLAALQSYGIACDSGMIARMKDARRDFAWPKDKDEIIAYCLEECSTLAALMTKLDANLQGAGLFPKRWDGAGAVASALLAREGVKAHIVPELKHLIAPVACAFFGGRIELCKVGRAKRPVYNYDIVSAYPAAAASLPSMQGVWMRTHGAFRSTIDRFSLYFVRWNFRPGEPWYPLPFRNARDGTITFPNEGAGWYWAPEYAAATKWAVARQQPLPWEEDAFTLYPDVDELPFGFVPALFAQRAAMKREGNGAQMALKLALNSLYGKLAQQLGALPGKPPPYYSLPWAGWITASTRARLVEAALSDPSAIIAFATDGIYSMRPLPIATGSTLGAWDGPGVCSDAVFVAAGIYWTQEDGGWKARYRGFDKEPMKAPDFVLDAWKRRERETAVPSTRFVTHKSALASEMLWAERETWRTIDRRLQIDGNSPKRMPLYDVRASGEYNPRSRLIPCEPHGNPGFEERQGYSAPYETFRLGEIDWTDEEAFTLDVEEGTL